tara:strand:- start:278 stop:661 length:384 start_codon:yes stop_codon:yes gene_type:complete
MKTKHTLGKLIMENYPKRLCSPPYTWSRDLYYPDVNGNYRLGKEKVTVYGDSSEEVTANAKLIASAPEMLNALHDISVNLRAIMDGKPNIAINTSLNKVNRALKKASDVELRNVDYTDAPDVKLMRV